MVYVPYKVVERLMLNKWREERVAVPKPTAQEIRCAWYLMLEFYPPDRRAFETFLARLPVEDRHLVRFRPYTE